MLRFEAIRLAPNAALVGAADHSLLTLVLDMVPVAVSGASPLATSMNTRHQLLQLKPIGCRAGHTSWTHCTPSSTTLWSGRLGCTVVYDVQTRKIMSSCLNVWLCGRTALEGKRFMESFPRSKILSSEPLRCKPLVSRAREWGLRGGASAGAGGAVSKVTVWS